MSNSGLILFWLIFNFLRFVYPSFFNRYVLRQDLVVVQPPVKLVTLQYIEVEPHRLWLRFKQTNACGCIFLKSCLVFGAPEVQIGFGLTQQHWRDQHPVIYFLFFNLCLLLDHRLHPGIVERLSTYHLAYQNNIVSVVLLVVSYWRRCYNPNFPSEFTTTPSEMPLFQWV